MTWAFFAVAAISFTACGYGFFKFQHARQKRATKNGKLSAKVELRREGDMRLLSLALINGSSQKIWAEECIFSLANFAGTASTNFTASCTGAIRIREYVRPGETLRVGL